MVQNVTDTRSAQARGAETRNIARQADQLTETTLKQSLIDAAVQNRGLPNPDAVRALVAKASVGVLALAIDGMRADLQAPGTKPEAKAAIARVMATMSGYMKPDAETAPAQYEDRLAEEYRKAGVEL